MPQYHNSCLRLSHKYQCKKKTCKQKNQANNTEEKAKTQTKKFPRPQRSLLAPTGALYIIVCNYLSKTSTVCFSTQRHIVSVITTKASTQQKQIFKQMMQQRNITIMSECTHIPRFPRCVTAIMSSLKVFIFQELLSTRNSRLIKWLDALRGSSPARCNNGTWQCDTVKKPEYNTIPCNTIQYNEMTCNTMQWNRIKYKTM